MYHTRFFYDVMAILVLCGLWLQGCQPSLQVTSEELILKKSRKTSHDDPAAGQVLVPDVRSFAHDPAVMPDAVLSCQRALSIKLEVTDSKPSAEPVARATRSATEQQLNHLNMRPKRPKREDFTLESSLQARLKTLEQDCELLRAENKALKEENETLKIENLLLHRDAGTFNQRVPVLVPTKLPAKSFGAEEWSRYLGEIGVAPPLPECIVSTLSSPCPFWPGEIVKNTHLLVLIPATVAGSAFSFNLLGELIRHPKGGGCPTKYDCYDSDVKEILGAQSPGCSYWVLMTRDVIAGSRNKDYAAQKSLVAAHAKRTGLPYELPSALEAATAILSHHVCSGERLYADHPWTYTRCQELVDNQYPVIVGGITPGGLFVSSSSSSHSDYGVASLLKF